jgi:ElaB/YqjD/DUF883 family membrane-anchored ribosome-binding protein
MSTARQFVCSFLVLASLWTEACNKKKPVLPPFAPAPTIAAELPDEIPENPETPAPEVAQAPVVLPPAKTKPKKPTHTTAKKTTPTATATSAAVVAPPPPANTTQTVASLRPPRNPGSEASPPDTAITAAMPSEAITKQKENTAQIVDATENSLKNLSRQLSDEEKAMKSQIQSYLQQSRKATTDGDFERAFNLAKKAQLLADALIKK